MRYMRCGDQVLNIVADLMAVPAVQLAEDIEFGLALIDAEFHRIEALDADPADKRALLIRLRGIEIDLIAKAKAQAARISKAIPTLAPVAEYRPDLRPPHVRFQEAVMAVQLAGEALERAKAQLDWPGLD